MTDEKRFELIAGAKKYGYTVTIENDEIKAVPMAHLPAYMPYIQSTIGCEPNIKFVCEVEDMRLTDFQDFTEYMANVDRCAKLIKFAAE